GLAKGRLTPVPFSLPSEIYAGKDVYPLEFRDGNDCEGLTYFGNGRKLVLATMLSGWELKKTLLHEVAHIAAFTRPDNQCRFRDEDEAIEHFAPGLVDILADPRNYQLVRFLTEP